VWSEINWNLDQAHKMIGLSSDSRANVVSVPVNYASRSGADDWYWYRPQSAVGLMSFNLGAYDPSRPPEQQQVLANHGTVVHSTGYVERSIIFTHQGVTPRRMMVNLSDTNISVVDIDDLDHPVAQADVEVAPYHSRVYRFGDYVVDEVRQGDTYYGSLGGSSQLRVKLAQHGLDDAPAVATLTIPGVRQIVQFKDKLVVLRVPGSSTGSSQVVASVVDFSDPTHPAVISSVTLPTVYVPYSGYCCVGWGYWPYWYGGSGWAVTDKGLGLLTHEYASYSVTQKLLFLDLTNPAEPRVASKVLATQVYDNRGGYVGRQYNGLSSDGSALWATYREKAGTLRTADGAQFTKYKSYVEKYPDGALVPEGPVNVIGNLVRVWHADGKDHFLTSDSSYELRRNGQSSSWVPQSRLHLLTRTTGRATLDDTNRLGGLQLGEVVGDDEKLFVSLRQSYWYWYAEVDVATGRSPEAPGDSLGIFDLRGGKLDQRFSGALGTYGSQLMGVNGDRLFVNLPGDGVLVVDVANLAAPVGQHFVRTLGWATHLTFAQTLAFVAAGNFGIYEIDLGSPASIASN
jgi:hypothetical protein